MYLLIRSSYPLRYVPLPLFTSHYVSINSWSTHSLNTVLTKFTSHYVSINSRLVTESGKVLLKFTSHYVSINSGAATGTAQYIANLHPTMYLLIR